MESARLKLYAAGFFGLFLTRSRGRGWSANSLRQQTNKELFRDGFEARGLATKNYSSWSMRPWLALRANNIPFDEVFYSALHRRSRQKTDFEFHTFRQGAGAD